jgi:hypothetical protein
MKSKEMSARKAGLRTVRWVRIKRNPKPNWRQKGRKNKEEGGGK